MARIRKMEYDVTPGLSVGVLLVYLNTAYFQWGLLKNDPYTYTVNEENCTVF